MKKLILILFILGMIGLVIAQDFTYKAGDTIDIKRNCFNNGTYCSASAVCNLTIIRPDTSVLLNNQPMTNQFSFYNYTLQSSDTWTSGFYQSTMVCNDGGLKGKDEFTLQITPSGNSGTANIVFFIFLILIFYGLNLVGFFGRNETVTILGGMALMFLGVYMINNGVIIYRDTLTLYFSYVTIGWGFVSTMMASYSIYQDM